MCRTQSNKLKTAANSIAMVSWVTYKRGDGICLHTTVWGSLKCLTREEAPFTICTTAIGGFFNNTKSGSYWEEGDPVHHQELCSFMGFTHLHHALIKHFPGLHWAAFMHATSSVWGIPKITGLWGLSGLRGPVFRVQPNPGALPTDNLSVWPEG